MNFNSFSRYKNFTFLLYVKNVKKFLKVFIAVNQKFFAYFTLLIRSYSFKVFYKVRIKLSRIELFILTTLTVKILKFFNLFINF